MDESIFLKTKTIKKKANSLLHGMQCVNLRREKGIYMCMYVCMYICISYFFLTILIFLIISKSTFLKLSVIYDMMFVERKPGLRQKNKTKFVFCVYFYITYLINFQNEQR